MCAGLRLKRARPSFAPRRRSPACARRAASGGRTWSIGARGVEQRRLDRAGRGRSRERRGIGGHLAQMIGRHVVEAAGARRPVLKSTTRTRSGVTTSRSTVPDTTMPSTTAAIGASASASGRTDRRSAGPRVTASAAATSSARVAGIVDAAGPGQPAFGRGRARFGRDRRQPLEQRVEQPPALGGGAHRGVGRRIGDKILAERRRRERARRARLLAAPARRSSRAMPASRTRRRRVARAATGAARPMPRNSRTAPRLPPRAHRRPARDARIPARLGGSPFACGPSAPAITSRSSARVAAT